MPEDLAHLGVVAVQVLSSDNPHLLTSREDRNGLAEEVIEFWTVRWLPPIGQSRTGFGSSESTLILLYLLGFSFLSLAKPLFEEAAKEAGKDLWKGIKALVSKLHKRQSAKSYRLQSNIYVIFELCDDFVAIQLWLSSEDDTPETEIEKELLSQLSEFASSWEDIQETIKRFEVGVNTPGSLSGSDCPRIHVIHRYMRGEKTIWTISGESSTAFFNRVRPQPPRGW
jgi:hypothetical protein